MSEGDTPNDLKPSDSGRVLVHAPKNQIVNISEVWAFLSVDRADNTEGIMAIYTPSGWMPALAADLDRLMKLEPLITEMVNETGVTARLVKFSSRSDVKTIEAKKQS